MENTKNLIRQLLENKEETSYSWLGIYCNPKIKQEVFKFQRQFSPIEIEELETEPHITIKYGLHTRNIQDLDPLLRVMKKSGINKINFEFGKLKIFATREGKDVLVANIVSDSIHHINVLSAFLLRHTDSYPRFHPHITIAYLAPGMPEQRKSKLWCRLYGTMWETKYLWFSTPEKKKYRIDLSSL